MAWASKKQYAILNSSEEGKDLIEKLPDLSQDEFQVEFGKFIGENGSSYEEDDDEDINYFGEGKELLEEDVFYVLNNQIDYENKTIGDLVKELKDQDHIGASYRHLRNVNEDELRNLINKFGEENNIEFYEH